MGRNLEERRALELWKGQDTSRGEKKFLDFQRWIGHFLHRMFACMNKREIG